jgi:FRG domain
MSDRREDLRRITMENDITVETYDEFLKVLYDIPPASRRFRSDYVYRGVDDKEWGLETSLQRMGSHYADVEGPLLRSFRKYARPHDLPSSELFFTLAVAQHHGLPTRVLDWTTSPRIAAHFATSNEKLFDVDGAIWCIDVAAARSLLPPELQHILHNEYAFLFTIEMLARFEKLRDFDELPRKDEFILFFEPPSLDDRIANQGAILCVMPGVKFDHKALLARPTNQRLCKRVIIPAALKWELRDKLDQDNITERMLFPGLDGTCRWLKRYYGAGPGAVIPVPASLGATTKRRSENSLIKRGSSKTKCTDTRGTDM